MKQSPGYLPEYPPVFFVKLTDAIRRRLTKISRRFTHPNVVMLEHMQNLWLLGAISVANELGVAGILKEGPKRVSEIAEITGALEEPLYRVLRLLASEEIFRESEGRAFSNTRLSASMLDSELRFFIQHTLLGMQFRIFGEMMHSVKTGRRTSELFVGSGMFEYMGSLPELNDLYNKAMTNTSRMQVAAILSAFGFDKFSHIVDVGGGLGFFLSSILGKYNSVRGTLFDLPQVISDPAGLLEKSGLNGRMQVIQGSFFDFIPGGGDLYTLKNILHGWSDDDCIKILKNIRRSIPEDGTLMIIESVVEEMNKPSWGKMSDIFMMAGLGGKERTRIEFDSILRQSGFRLQKIKDTVSPLRLIIAVPERSY